MWAARDEVTIYNLGLQVFPLDTDTWAVCVKKAF